MRISLRQAAKISYSTIILTCYMIIVVSGFTPILALAADPPFSLPKPSELAKLKSAVITTNKGNLFFELFPEEAPWHVANFKYLADNGFYKNQQFDRVEKGFLVQGGAPHGTSPVPTMYSIEPEFNSHPHRRGTLGMARGADDMNPRRRSSSTQFHILLEEASRMDGSYTVFGQLLKGDDVLDSLVKGDRIVNIKVYVAK